jgi:hypothetical protein
MGHLPALMLQLYRNQKGQSSIIDSQVMSAVTLFLPAGSDPDASTDARVYIDLHGTRGQLMDLLLRDTGDTFNRYIWTQTFY